jgi:hypothetical protein
MKDLLQLEAKLSQIGLSTRSSPLSPPLTPIGIMPPSVLLREESPHIMNSSINFSTAKLEDSFLYLTAPRGGSRKSNGDGSTDRPNFPAHQTLFPSTIAQKYPSPMRSRSRGSPSSVKQSERQPQPMSGPYGGKKKTSTDTSRAPTAYWGSAAGGFLSWATTGYQQQHPPQTHSGSDSVPKPNSHGAGAGALSVNWNDRSMILPTEGDFSMDHSSSAGALQLLGTIKRLSLTPSLCLDSLHH